MSFYGQKNYADIQGINGRHRIADIGCFLTAFCNLEQRFGKDIDPPSLNRLFIQRGVYIDVDDGVRDDLGWQSITAYDGQTVTGQINNNAGGSWPQTNNAIVKFSYKSPKTGAPSTHLVLVADWQKRLIVDSWDGVVRLPGYYGDPVAWAAYTHPEPQVVVVPTPSAPQSTATIGTVVVLKPGDTIAGIALRYHLQTADVLAHNGLTWDSARALPVGYQLRLPISQRAAPATVGYTVEVLPEPKHMHVSKPGGAEKWGFGNVKGWSDFVNNGHVAENTNVTIVAIATVIVGNDTAAYYMDQIALGDYKTTGKVANTIGFNWKDLTEGDAPSAKPTPAPTPPTPPQPAPAPPQAVIPPPTEQPPSTSPNAYKTSYTALPAPTMYVALKTTIVREFDGRRPDKTIYKNQAVKLAGTFIKDGVLYGRPQGSVDGGYWFGIPMDALISEDDLYNTEVTLPEKVAMKYALSYREQIIVILSRFLAAINKFLNK